MLMGLHIVSWALLLLALLPLGYLGLLACGSWRMRAPSHLACSQRFVFVVPAHNEAAQIAQTVASLRAVDYPSENFAVWVVADNCTDDTAQIAAAAGAHVLQRSHATERGKGYALNYAFAQVLAEGGVDAVVVVDADSIVSPNFLRAFAARLVDGELAIQAEYGVRNPSASWRTRLMAIALAMFHRVRSIPRERMGLSAGLRGNGMCFAVACLKRFPHEAFGLVEDVEYGLALGGGGVRVAYADEAQVLGEMVSQGKASESQRERWEGGRQALVRQRLPGLFRQSLQQRSALLFDLAVDLAIPPLSRVALLLLLGSVAEAVRLSLGAAIGPVSYGWLAAWTCLVLYVGRGMQLSGLGMQAVWAMLFAPGYVAWKVLLALKPKKKNSEWVRTEREHPAAAASKDHTPNKGP